MRHILIAAILFLGSSTAVLAESQNVFANVQSGGGGAWRTARSTPVADSRAATDPKRIAENNAAILGGLRTLAEQGDAEAQYKLGLMYLRGRGVAQNFVAAYMWIYLANAGATGDLEADTVKARFEISSLMTPEQVADARQRAIEWQKKRTPGMPTPSKDELINTFAKVDACSDAGHLARDTVEKDIVPRVQYYARLFFTERDVDEMGVSIPVRKKSAVTAFGWGCESAFHSLAALPLPKMLSNRTH